jgi:hypothetical protein
MSWFFDAAPYVLAVCAILLGLFEIIKDWKEYKSKWLRIAVALVFIIVSIVSIASLYHDNQEKKKAEVANKAETEELRNDLRNTQVALRDTRNALDHLSKPPGPKAKLSLTFVPYRNPSIGQPVVPVTETTLPRSTDGSVHVDLTVLNLTKVDAVAANINVKICDDCKFAKEPQGLTRLAGMEDRTRFLFLTRIHAKEAYFAISLDVIPPPSVENFTVGFEYRCNTCVLPTGAVTGIVHIAR